MLIAWHQLNYFGLALPNRRVELGLAILIRFRLNKLVLGFPMPAVWHGLVFLGGVSSGRRRGHAEDGSNIYDSSPDFAGGDRTSEEHELAGSGVLSLL